MEKGKYFRDEEWKKLQSKNMKEYWKHKKNGTLQTRKKTYKKKLEDYMTTFKFFMEQIQKGNYETYDERMLKMKDIETGNSIAHILGFYSFMNRWTTNNKEILKLTNKKGVSVAHELAKCSDITNWNIEDEEILNLYDENGISVQDILLYSKDEMIGTERLLILENEGLVVYDEEYPETISDITLC